MKKIHIAKNTVQETLLLPLYARKLGSEWFAHILYDPFARKIVRQIDYDFSIMDRKKSSLIWQFGALAGLLRSKAMLCEMQTYLAAYPRAAVVNMGCGFDQTPLLGDNGQMKLYNIDLPDVIATRNAVLPPMDREQNIAADLTDAAWLQHIDASHGTFLFAAGVFMYLEKEAVHQLVRTMTDTFPQGCLVFDTLGKTAVKILLKYTLSTLKIQGIDGMFYSNNPQQDLQWSKEIHLSVRNYLTGYVDLKQNGVPLLLRWMAILFERLWRITICRMQWSS